MCICLVTISVTWLRCHLMAANVFTLVLQLYLVFLRTELSNHKSSKHVKKYIIVFCSKLQSSHMDEDWGNNRAIKSLWFESLYGTTINILYPYDYWLLMHNFLIRPKSLQKIWHEIYKSLHWEIMLNFPTPPCWAPLSTLLFEVTKIEKKIFTFWLSLCFYG